MKRVNQTPMCQSRRGIMVTLFAVCLPVMLILCAFCINVAYMELARTELQVATDAATRAAGRRLTLDRSQQAAINEGIDAASRNFVGGDALQLRQDDFEFGESTRDSLSSRYVFTPTTGRANAVRVNGRRTADSAGGELQLFFSNFASVDDFSTSQTGTSTQIELDIAVVIDRSGSMAYGIYDATPTTVFYPPSSAPADWFFGDPAPPDCRWRDTLSAVEVFMSELDATPQEEYVTVLTYTDQSTTDVDFTSDYRDLGMSLDRYTQSYDSGATNIGGGIVGGINALASTGGSRPWAAKAIIVLTDGRQTEGLDPVTAAERAVAEGITVYTVTFSNEADKSKMAAVAAKGLGKHIHANSPADLIQAFREIGKNLPTLITN